MAYRQPLNNFSKGVLTKELWGRSDIVPYNAAVRQGTNVVILKYGGLQKRMGTRFVYEILDGKKRLLPFEGAYEASYALLMGQASLRLAALGGMVIEEQLTIETLSLTNPVQIRASYHGYSTGDEVFLIGLLGTTDLNGLVFPVTVIDQHHFTIPIDGTNLDPLTGDTGGTVRSGAPPPPPPPPEVPPPVEPVDPPLIGGGGLGGGSGYDGIGSPIGDGAFDRHVF
jgi:hypothetical protein